MSMIYVAQAKSLSDWGSDVGLSKHIFLIGVADEAEAAVADLNARAHGGAADWKLIGAAPAAGITAQAAHDRLAKREKRVDPTYYPRIKGIDDLFRVAQRNVENHLVIKNALENQVVKAVKVKPADFAAYLIKNALE